MVGNGRIWAWTLFACGAVVFVMVTKETKWIDAITVSLGVAIVLLSIVVLTGYAGQLSLAQYSIAGFGAYVAGRWSRSSTSRSCSDCWPASPPPCHSV